MSNRISELRGLSGEQLLARAGELLPPWVVLLLVLAIAWQLVRLTWLLLPGEQSVAAISPTPAMATTASPATTVNYDLSAIVNANLFGEKPAAAVEPPPTENFDELDETQLQLILRGTIAATDDRVALAIIAGDNGEERVYAIGEAVSNGRKLHSVLPDRAILNNNGELESLKLPRDYEATTTSRTTSRRTTTRTNTARAGRQLQRTLSENPAKLTDLIRPQPVFSNGKQLGYRVYPGRRRQQFVALGLKPGDLVTEINGTPLNDPAKGADIFRSLGESNQVTVTVERNGAPEVLVLDTEAINNMEGGKRR
ncbi:MAG: type II secretion system protein GspC [Gammaproteobacteria bacterium]|nr:type II secretion system protein GspC [Gammaproteobacteria bacterium]